MSLEEAAPVYLKVIPTSEDQDSVVVEKFYEGAVQELDNERQAVQANELTLEDLQEHSQYLAETIMHQHSRRSQEMGRSADQWTERLREVFVEQRETTLESERLMAEHRAAMTDLDNARRAFYAKVLERVPPEL